MQNISKYCQLSNFLLLEYEFHRDSNPLTFTTLSNPTVVTSKYKISSTDASTKQFYEGIAAVGYSNNVLPLNSVPTNAQRTSWFTDASDYSTTYPSHWSSSVSISGVSSYPLDTVRLHIVSGYNFDDVDGFLLQVRAKDNSTNLVDLTNFTYAKQDIARDVVKFAANTLFLGNRYYDKYVEVKVPSVYALGGDTTSELGIALNVQNLSDVYITYSIIPEIVNKEYTLQQEINLQLPVTSVADSFNCFIAESTLGDFIEYYATWNNLIIGNDIGDIESGRIRLYTSNNPNDNYEEFTNAYGTTARKWVVIHEISVYESLAGGGNTALLTQKYSFTQDGNFLAPNYFRPILVNSDIDAYYTIQYTCRLMNRMDGTQIIRKAAFSSTDPKKYGMKFTRLNVDNVIPYKVFNKIEAEKANIMTGGGVEKTKYVKVFFDTTRVIMNAFNEIFPQGVGPLFLKQSDAVYKFKFEKLDLQGNRVNVDLSGTFNYLLSFRMDDNSLIEVGPTYSTNMNTVIGEIEFKLTKSQASTILQQQNTAYSIVVKNPNGTEYNLYDGNFYNYKDQTAVMANFNSLFNVTNSQTTIAALQSEINSLHAELAALRTT